MARPKVTIDGNEAAAYVAHQINEVIAIYPITPSSNMGEWADQWSAEQKPNIWGSVPTVIEMQSEGGAHRRRLSLRRFEPMAEGRA
jgi:pyruvate-ferredoxin/flavodoxin oxidoreductase